MPKWVSNKQEPLKRVQHEKTELEEETEAEPNRDQIGKRRGTKKTTGKPKETVQRNFTDPESRLMKTSQGFVQVHNDQAGVDSKYRVIVARTLTTGSNDMQMIPLLG